jgi:SAM-dependent methyltransferase
MTTPPSAAYWDDVYRNKGDREVSWFEERPALSLSLVREAGVGRDAAIIDIGGGASRLVDALVAEGQAHVAVLDISLVALQRARQRVPSPAVEWIVADVTDWVPTRRYDLWHDRAAFHFLVEPARQRAYVETMRSSVAAGGKVIIGTFAPDGPEKCSGLPVARHSSATLQQVLGPDFALLGERRYDHHTPWDAVQRFQFSTFRRVGQPGRTRAGLTAADNR